MCRLFDASREPTSDIASVNFLESVSADKSLWCRLNLSLKLLMSYLLLTLAGEVLLHFSHCNSALHLL